MLKTTNSELQRVTPEQFAEMEKLPIVVVLDNIRSANNVGSFFRTCDSFGIDSLVLCGITAQPPSRDIHKSALGAELTVGWRYVESTLDAVKELHDAGYVVCSVEQVIGSVSLEGLKVERDCKYALVFGNEVDGVLQEVVDASDLAIEVPQVGTKHSLNVSVCGGLVIWEVFKNFYKN